MCGLFVLASDGLRIEHNKIRANGERNEEPVDAAQPGVRAGIHVWLALDLQAARSGTAAGANPKDAAAAAVARPRSGAGQLRVHANAVQQPLGRALFLPGAGSMHITDNFLTSEGGGAPATDALASTVLVAWARLPTGKPAFHDNQVSFLMPDAPRGMEIASALLLSLDDLSCNDNQFEWHTQQRVVLAGIAQSQRREAKRLAASYPEDDPRIARAVERAAQVEQLQAEASAQAVLAGRAAQTFQQEGLFHGCVQQADGTPATAHGVILQMPAEKRSRTAKTDEAGYFRIELETGRAAGGQAKAPAWAEHLQRMAGFQPAQQEPAPSADAAAGPEPASSSTGEPTAVSTVTVLDEAGRMVLQDPAPPSFSDMRSEFRLYVLGGTGSGRARAGRG